MILIYTINLHYIDNIEINDLVHVQIYYDDTISQIGVITTRAIIIYEELNSSLGKNRLWQVWGAICKFII